MMYLRYALYAPLSLLMNLLVILTSPLWAAMVAVTGAARLPGSLTYLYTDDDDIYGSGMTKDPVPQDASPSAVWWRFKRALWWLCRNPGFGFARDVLGRPIKSPTLVKEIRHTDGEWDSGQFMLDHFIATTPDGRRWFNYRRDIPWAGGKKYIKLWFGWQDDGRLKIMFNPFLTSRGNQ